MDGRKVVVVMMKKSPAPLERSCVLVVWSSLGSRRDRGPENGVAEYGCKQFAVRDNEEQREH